MIYGRNAYSQQINDLIKHYGGVRVTKKSVGQGDDLLDYASFKYNYKLIGSDLIKQKHLDTDPRVIQKVVFQDIARQLLFLKKKIKKKTVIEFYKATAKVL